MRVLASERSAAASWARCEASSVRSSCTSVSRPLSASCEKKPSATSCRARCNCVSASLSRASLPSTAARAWSRARRRSTGSISTSNAPRDTCEPVSAVQRSTRPPTSAASRVSLRGTTLAGASRTGCSTTRSYGAVSMAGAPVFGGVAGWARRKGAAPQPASKTVARSRDRIMTRPCRTPACRPRRRTHPASSQRDPGTASAGACGTGPLDENWDGPAG